MKYPLPPTAFSFDASAKTITFSGVVPAYISNILNVTNITRGVLYFQPQAGLSYSGSYASPVLTLLADTNGHSNTDSLLIIYDDGLEGATSDNQDVGNLLAASIDEKLPALSGGRIPVDVGTSIDIGEVEVKNDAGNPIPVYAASLPLPTGAASATNQNTANTWLGNIDGKLPALSSGRVPVDVGTSIDIGEVEIKNDSGNPVPVTGPLTDIQLRATAVPISATSLPLPSGAATAANQTTANTSLASIAGLTIPAHDYIALSYTGTNLTGVVYKTGGSGGTTVATLTLGYSGTTLTSVTKS